MANTPLQEIIELFFKGISGSSTFILVELIIFITSFLSVLGIHHLITVTAIGLSISGSVLGLTDITYTLTLIGAYTIAMIISPFAPFNIIAGGLLKESPFVVSLRWNRTFAFLRLLAPVFYYLGKLFLGIKKEDSYYITILLELIVFIGYKTSF